MNLLLSAILLQITSILGQKNCDKLGVRVYEDMGCTPKYERCFRECPNEFICPNLHESSTECYYKNLTLKVGESVRHPDQFCDLACFCDEGGKFVCAVVDCAEYFGITPPPGCYTTYNLQTCCSSGEKCGGTNVTCQYGGETYKEGKRFFPKDSCSMCVCQKGFRGKIEAPFCTRRKCNVQLHSGEYPKKRCAPVYWNDTDVLCCPGQWICPDGNEHVTGTSKSNKICYFGNRTLKVGQTIQKYMDVPVICECKIPPLLTCIRQSQVLLENKLRMVAEKNSPFPHTHEIIKICNSTVACKDVKSTSPITMNWNEAFLTEFFELYKEHSCLWKVKSIQYHDKQARKKAMNILVDKFREVKEDATEEHVKKKINNFRTSYKRELKLVKSSVNSGVDEEDVYKPKLWYFNLLSFLEDQDVPRPSNVSDEEEIVFPEIQVKEEVSDEVTETLSETQDGDDGAGGVPFHDSDADRLILHNASLQRKRKSFNRFNASKSKKIAFFSSGQKTHDNDEFVITGKKIAFQLKRMDERQRIIAEKLISDVMFYGRMGKLSEDAIIKLP